MLGVPSSPVLECTLCALLPCFPQSGFRFDCGHDDVCDGLLARDLLLRATVPFARPPRPVLSMWPETVSPSSQLVVRSASMVGRADFCVHLNSRPS